MAAPLTSLTLYLDIVNNRLVTSLYSATPFVFPTPYYGDVYSIILYPVVPIVTQTFAPGNVPIFKPFVESAVTLTINVGLGTGPVAGVYTIMFEALASGGVGDASPWTWNADAQLNGFFSGLLSFYTAALTTAMSGVNALQTTLQFEIADSKSVAANPASAYVVEYSGPLVINQPVIPPGGVASPSGPAAQYYTKAQIDNLCVKFSGNPAGATIQLPGPGGTHGVVIGGNDDGTPNESSF